MSVFNSGWLLPEWPAPAGVRAVFTTRAGGVSTGPYASLNLGDHVGDEAAAVATNRRLLEQALGARPVFMQQVHGAQWADLSRSLSASAPMPHRQPIVADACLARSSGTACTIMVADCLPVLFTDSAGRAVAAAHAGWRGLAGDGKTGVLEATVGALLSTLGPSVNGRLARGRPASAHPASAVPASEFMAWLGPCIGPEAFEVGPEVKAAFEAGDAAAAAMFKPYGSGKWLADLPGLARRRLRALGLTRLYGNDGSAAWCTVANPSSFFSHRRDRVSGRMAACIWKV